MKKIVFAVLMMMAPLAQAEDVCGVIKSIQFERMPPAGGLKNIQVTLDSGAVVNTFPMDVNLTTALAAKLKVCFQGPYMSRPAQLKSIE